MTIHNQGHALNSANDHLGGTTPGTAEVNVIGTNDAGNVAEVTVENIASTPSTSTIVKRQSDGHIKLPTSNWASDEAVPLSEVENLIATGVWRGPVHSVVADNTDSGVGSGTPSENVALQVDDKVINTTDGKVYTVTSIAGGTTGDLVTWDAGVLPTMAVARIDKLTDVTYIWDTQGSTWVNTGSSSHSRQHSMTSSSDHTANNWNLFHSNGSGQVAELALGTKDAPLLSGGTAANPVFGGMLLAPSVVTAAGADPVDSDVSAWGNNTMGVVVGTGGNVYFTWKNSTDVYYVQATSI